MVRDWRPGASQPALVARARMLEKTRRFFKRLEVLEVDTPLLAATAASDPHLDALSLETGNGVGYLQTSPEHALKRLVAAGSGPVYQLGKAFRAAENGNRHNHEFTMLEWYRPKFTLSKMIAETVDLLSALLGKRDVRKVSYRQLFESAFDFDPHRVSDRELQTVAQELAQRSVRDLDRDDLLNLLMAMKIEPNLGAGEFTVVTEWPASQAALAEVGRDKADNPVALRFEIYADGYELANGYDELRSAGALRRRYQQDCERRRALGKALPPLDTRLLDAMASGLPQCCGVAVGFDRLLMIQLGATSIDEVLAFSAARI